MPCSAARPAMRCFTMDCGGDGNLRRNSSFSSAGWPSMGSAVSSGIKRLECLAASRQAVSPKERPTMIVGAAKRDFRYSVAAIRSPTLLEKVAFENRPECHPGR
jgi:hypothetical protein